MIIGTVTTAVGGTITVSTQDGQVVITGAAQAVLTAEAADELAGLLVRAYWHLAAGPRQKDPASVTGGTFTIRSQPARAFGFGVTRMDALGGTE